VMSVVVRICDPIDLIVGEDVFVEGLFARINDITRPVNDFGYIASTQIRKKWVYRASK
jgi:hypothetical protein